MKKLSILFAAFAVLVLHSCNSDEVCIKCKMTTIVGGGGGNQALFPGDQEFCGSESEVDSFEASYHSQAYDWKLSWTWPGAGSWSSECDRY
ncbi:MAG: hypothetical protein RLZZ71_1012 [Bacteroidota bacterium]|jgi:hypothetical protein